MSISLTAATKRLRIGKRKLYQMLESEGITPILKSGHKLLSEHDLKRVEDALKQSSDTAEDASDTSAETCQHSTESGRDTAEDASDTGKNGSPTLLARMDSEIEHLRKLLSEEKEERKAERQERENYQKLVMVLQQDNQSLRQQLLEAPQNSNFDIASSSEDVEEPVEIITPSTAASTAHSMEYVPRSSTSSSWGLGIGLGAVAAAIIFYVLISDQGARLFPHIQQKLVGALHLTDTGSIVPYSFDQDGTLR